MEQVLPQAVDRSSAADVIGAFALVMWIFIAATAIFMGSFYLTGPPTSAAALEDFYQEGEKEDEDEVIEDYAKVVPKRQSQRKARKTDRLD
jgi:hypothetical protein